MNPRDDNFDPTLYMRLKQKKTVHSEWGWVHPYLVAGKQDEVRMIQAIVSQCYDDRIGTNIAGCMLYEYYMIEMYNEEIESKDGRSIEFFIDLAIHYYGRQIRNKRKRKER